MDLELLRPCHDSLLLTTLHRFFSTWKYKMPTSIEEGLKKLYQDKTRYMKKTTTGNEGTIFCAWIHSTRLETYLMQTSEMEELLTVVMWLISTTPARKEAQGNEKELCLPKPVKEIILLYLLLERSLPQWHHIFYPTQLLLHKLVCCWVSFSFQLDNLSLINIKNTIT